MDEPPPHRSSQNTRWISTWTPSWIRSQLNANKDDRSYLPLPLDIPTSSSSSSPARPHTHNRPHPRSRLTRMIRPRPSFTLIIFIGLGWVVCGLIGLHGVGVGFAGPFSVDGFGVGEVDKGEAGEEGGGRTNGEIGGNGGDGGNGGKREYTSLGGGTDGFRVVDNVWVKDRVLYLIPDPEGSELPHSDHMITSSPNSVPIVSSSSSSTTSNPNPDPNSASQRRNDLANLRKLASNSLTSKADDGFAHFPDIQRVVRLSVEEAEGVEGVPGWAGGTGRAGERKRWGWGWWGNGGDQEVEVLDGTTFYFADDPDIGGWGSLMFHYYHFAAELIFGTEHLHAIAQLEERSEGTNGGRVVGNLTSTLERLVDRATRKSGGLYTIGGPTASNARPHPLDYLVTEQDRIRFERQRPSPPKRVVFPFCASWEGKELQEVMMGNMFGDEVDLVRRDDWTRLNRDHRWRKFERVIFVDRHSAHLRGDTQTSRWNKMAIDVLDLPIPATYPYNPWLDAQDRLADGLGLPAVPLTRTVDREGKRKALSRDAVKVVYVSRQATDRKLDDKSEDGLGRVLRGFAEEGVVGEDGKRAEVIVEVVEWEFLSAREQIEIAYSADVFIGIHGNGLTHILWTRPGATVIELWPLHAFIRDYQIVAAALDHDYIPVWNDTIISEDTWRQMPTSGESEKLHNGQETVVDETYLRDLLGTTLRGMAW